MRNVLLIFVFTLSVMIAPCVAQNTASIETPIPKVDKNDYTRFTNLAEILRAKGLEVIGTGDNVNIRIMGISSIKLNTTPLFVLDNVQLGSNYTMANNAVTPQNIASVRVIIDSSQLTRWGEQGINGVIMIKTKAGSQKPQKTL